MARRLKFSNAELEAEAAVKRTRRPSSGVARSVGTTASATLHSEISQYEQDNVGVESAHRGEEAAENSLRITANHRQKKHNEKQHRSETKKHGKSAAAEHQKRKVKKDASAKKSGKAAAKAAEKTEKAAEKAAEFAARHKTGTIVAVVILVVGLVVYSLLSGGSAVAQGGSSVVGATTYPSADEDLLAAEAQYAGMEAALQQQLDNYESTHSYDEYRYELDDIGHDPYVLLSLLTALHNNAWTISDVQSDLSVCYEMQYSLTETVTTETRTRTEEREVTDPETGEVTTEEVEVEYTYYICTVTLKNYDLSHIPIQLMSEEQLAVYAMYMTTLGNRPDLFPTSIYISLYYNDDFLRYTIPPEALEDEVFAAMMAEATKYLGYPYVWGGSTPATSFDCSGYVSWVINHSGWNYGRLGAIGLCNICTPVSAANAKPGDLVFFKYTYAAEIPDGVTHVGIYVGNNMMIHCGDPIQYADLTSAYWSSHFYCYGRLPTP
ncbi:MAG: C40 family peptidase [Oscillospiraceae bacterium]|nr:C40 family peptidase [Oscillospiraceae bacterium]